MISHGQTKGVSLRDKIDLSKFKQFGVDNIESYAEKIKHMNLVDLHEHAIKFGIRPSVERKRMEKTLVDEFKKAKAQYNLGTSVQEVPEITEKKKTALDMLAFIK